MPEAQSVRSRSSEIAWSGKMKTMTTTTAEIAIPSDSKQKPQIQFRTCDPFAETDILPAVEPIELDKRLPFFGHLDGMVSLRKQWDKFWRGL